MRVKGVHLLTNPGCRLLEGPERISYPLGRGLLLRGNCREVMAFRIRHVAFCREAGLGGG